MVYCCILSKSELCFIQLTLVTGLKKDPANNPLVNHMYKDNTVGYEMIIMPFEWDPNENNQGLSDSWAVQWHNTATSRTPHLDVNQATVLPACHQCCIDRFAAETSFQNLLWSVPHQLQHQQIWQQSWAKSKDRHTCMEMTLSMLKTTSTSPQSVPPPPPAGTPAPPPVLSLQCE